MTMHQHKLYCKVKNLDTVNCTLYSVQCPNCLLYSTNYSVQYTLYIAQIVQFISTLSAYTEQINAVPLMYT